MMDTKAMMRCSIWSYFWTATSASTANPATRLEIQRGQPRMRETPKAAPRNSARAVAMQAAMMEPPRRKFSLRGKKVRQASARHSPVTMPRWAAMCWRRMSMSVDSVMTQRRL